MFSFIVMGVKLHMKSGATLTGRVTKINQKYRGDDLTGLEWTGYMPFYFKMADITAIEIRKRVNWRRLFVK